jgi:hypothetical protein
VAISIPNRLSRRRETAGLLVLAQVLLCPLAEAVGGLGDDGRLHGLAEDATSTHDADFLSGDGCSGLS